MHRYCKIFNEEYLNYHRFLLPNNFVYFKIQIKDGWVNRDTGKKSEPRIQFTEAKQLQDVLGFFAKKLVLLMNISELETEFIHKLIIADISPRQYPPHHQSILAALNSVNFSLYTSRSEVEEVLRIYMKDEGVLQFMLKNVFRKTKTQLAFRFNLHSLTENNEEVGAAIPSFTHFDGETLFLKGENSDYITAEDEPLISAHFSNYKIVPIKNAGHWLHAENPTQFFNEVSDFLSK